MPDFKNMIKGMEEKETPEAPTQEETEKAGKLADSGFKIGEHRFIGKDNNKTNPGFIAYGGNNPDQKLSTKELAKIYDEQQKAKSVSPEQDRLTKLKKDAIAESQATAKKEAPLADKPKTRKVGDEEFPAPQKAQYQESRFLKDDPYYKLIKEKSPMSYREHLYYPENGKFALHDTEGNKIGEFDDEENTLAAIDKRYSDKAGRGEEDIMSEYRDIKQDDIPEAIRQLEEKKKTAKNDDEWERYDEQARLLRRDWEENYGREPEDDAPAEPRLLKPTDTFTQKELDDYAEYIDSANGWDGWRIEKLPNGNYYGNITLADPDEESIEITPAELAEVLKNDLISNPETAQDLYEAQGGKSAPSPTFNGMIEDMKEKEASEQPAREEVVEKPTLEERLGASRGMAGFLNSIDNPNNKYRVRYGYINEDDYGDESNSKVEDMDSYEAALKRYSDLNWLKDRDDKGRKFIRIETSGDGGKTYTGSLFSDAQK